MIRLNLINGECLEKMRQIPDKSIDLILTDPPYGTTANPWDEVISFEKMWKELNRIIKDGGSILLFGSEPFSSKLRLSNLKMFKHDWIWYKNTCTGIAQAKYAPMKNHEIVSVFAKGKNRFYPIKAKTKSEHIYNCAIKGLKRNITSESSHNSLGGVYGGDFQTHVNPRTILEFKSVNNRAKDKIHPTQKPVDLLAYLIKTYSLEGDTVLDFTAGSFSTAIACLETNRSFIGIEQDLKFYRSGVNRCKDWVAERGVRVKIEES